MALHHQEVLDAEVVEVELAGVHGAEVVVQVAAAVLSGAHHHIAGRATLGAMETELR